MRLHLLPIGTTLVTLLSLGGCAPTIDAAETVSPALTSTVDRPECHTADVRAIERPEVRSASATFAYAYRVHAAEAPAPTVIYLPGGPGQGAIAMARAEIPVPPSFSVIATDPRGAACNAPAASEVRPDAFYRTDEIADDILAIVRAEHLDEYFLYGVSYGTYLATVVAARAQAAGLPPPRAVVLEGIVGRTFAAGEPEVAYRVRWGEILASLPPAAQDKLRAAEPPLGFTRKEWGAFVRTGLSIGTMPNADRPFLAQLLAGLASDDPAATEPLRTMVAQLAADEKKHFSDENFMHVYQKVGCREVAETMNIDFELRSGDLVSRQDLCGGHAVGESFSAANHRLTMPIWYFEGTHDPNTPFWQAEFHFDHQPAAKRTLIGVEGAGHNPLGINLASCAAGLWGAIAGGVPALDPVLASCPAKVTLRTAEPTSY